MKILVDADAFPNALKEVLMRTVLKRQITTIFVANKKISIPNVPFVSMEVVPQGLDVADNYIAECCEAEDMVITADIPLADRVVSKGSIALDPRGTIYDEHNIKSLLAIRNLMQELRDSGEITGGPSPIGEKDVRAFADGLNKLLMKRKS
ncbi:MAG: YaiI/YqxD family protein [Sulfurospirillaceae bacterium]|nr:YaiI/YqxD family protein [Sulfurospirillaceae bacterium]